MPTVGQWQHVTMPADWDLLEAVYAFARDRQTERLRKAENDPNRYRYERFDSRSVDAVKSHLRHLQWQYAEAKKTGTNSAISAAIDVFRVEAMRNSQHPDYDPLWTIPPK